MPYVDEINRAGEISDIYAKALSTARNINGMAFNGTSNITDFAVCATAADTAAKTATITGFSLATGSQVTIKFTNGNTAANPTLEINNSGAKSIKSAGTTTLTPDTIAAGETVQLVYDGTNWMLINGNLYPELSNVKSALYDENGVGLNGFYKSGYINLSGDIGSEVTITPTSANNRACIVYPCKKNDRFFVTGTGPSGIQRPFAFVDADYKLVTKSVSTNTYTNLLLFAPCDGYIICNANTQNAYGLSMLKYDGDIDVGIVNATPAFISDGYITTNVTEGTEVVLNPERSVTYSYIVIPCKKDDKFVITGTGAVAARLWAFIDANKNLIEKSKHNITAKELEKTAPADGWFIANVVSANDFALKYYPGYAIVNAVVQGAPTESDGAQYFLNKRYITTSGAENSEVDIANPTTGNTWGCYVIPVKAGDYLVITGSASHAARLWAFTDENKKLRSNARPLASEENKVIQAVDNGYCIVNVQLANPYSVKIIRNGKTISYTSEASANVERYYLLRQKSILNANTPSYIRMMNCYGNTENVHPKVLYIPDGFGGHKYWMAYTPYPNGETEYENPCVAFSDDGFIWNGIAANPLATRVDDGTTNYNSDTHLVLKGSTLECWYRWADNANTVEVLYRRTSTDGVTWTAAEEMYRSEGAQSYLLSPAIIWDGTNSKYLMWVISSKNGYAIKYYESNADGDEWTEIRRIPLVYEHDGIDYRPWHLDVIIDDEKYIALVMGKDSETNNSVWSLFITTSSDNIDYSTPYAVMLGNPYSWDQLLYRSSIVKIGNIYRVYYSAKTKRNHYGISITEGDDLKTFVGKFDRADAFA